MYAVRINNDVVLTSSDQKTIIQKYNTIYYAFECVGMVEEDNGYYRFMLDDKHEVCITTPDKQILEATGPAK